MTFCILIYYSIESQKTYSLSVENGRLSIFGFPSPDKTVLTPLKKDMIRLGVIRDF